MTPERLSLIRWSPDTLARAFERDVSLIGAWLNGDLEIPPMAAAWVETVAQHMEAAETLKFEGVEGEAVRGVARAENDTGASSAYGAQGERAGDNSLTK